MPCNFQCQHKYLVLYSFNVGKNCQHNKTPTNAAFYFILLCSMCKTHYVQICNKYILPLKTDTFPFDFHFSISLRNVHLLSHILLLEVFSFFYLLCKDYLVYLLCFYMLISVFQTCVFFLFAANVFWLHFGWTTDFYIFQ